MTGSAYSPSRRGRACHTTRSPPSSRTLLWAIRSGVAPRRSSSERWISRASASP